MKRILLLVPAFVTTFIVGCAASSGGSTGPLGIEADRWAACNNGEGHDTVGVVGSWHVMRDKVGPRGPQIALRADGTAEVERIYLLPRDATNASQVRRIVADRYELEGDRLRLFDATDETRVELRVETERGVMHLAAGNPSEVLCTSSSLTQCLSIESDRDDLHLCAQPDLAG